MSAKRKIVASKKKAGKVTSSKKPAAPRPDEMTAEVIEFITAIDEYKRQQERPFPSWSEVLEILKTLGYERSPL